MTDDECPKRLHLAGYILLSPDGFALPCYAARPEANQWFIAICTVDGDHTGEIAGFEMWDAEGVKPLPLELQIEAKVGAPWLDVFVWAGKPHVGVPAAILRELEADLPHILAEIPISLLDLALSAGDIDTGPLVQGAFDHVCRRHGKAIAENWLREMLVREQARLIVRRHLIGAGAVSSQLNDVRDIIVEQIDGRLQLTLPQSIYLALGHTELKFLDDCIQTLVAPIGVPLEIINGSEPVDVDELEEGPTPEPASEKASFNSSNNILIIVSGDRARAIARELTQPEWVPLPDNPTSDHPRYLLRRNGEAELNNNDAKSVNPIIDITDEIALPSQIDNYAVIVWLVDDHIIMDSKRRRSRYEKIINLLYGTTTPLLVAPALPLIEPSRLLSESTIFRPFEILFNCIIDTSAARSPFWTGNSRHSLERRIGDIVTGAAMLFATHKEYLTKQLKANSSFGLLIFSHALARTNSTEFNHSLRFLSESCSNKYFFDPADKSVFAFRAQALRRIGSRLTSGYCSLSPHYHEFRLFARAVVSGVAGIDFTNPSLRRKAIHLPDQFNTEFDKLDEYDTPREIQQELVYPRYAAAVRARTLTSETKIIVTAERPSVGAINAAFRAGWNIARYTDIETILTITRVNKHRPYLKVPREIRLPQLKRLDANRRLAVRGADTRDIFRIPLRVFEDWQSMARESSLTGDARIYRGSVDDKKAPEMAISREAVERAIHAGDPAAWELMRMLGHHSIEPHRRSEKRIIDLRAAWTAPRDGTHRYALEDGRLPISMILLPPDAVPTDQMFIIDGDRSVPALFNSRIFDVWARATMSRSSNGISRFSIRDTFEALPIPSALTVLNDDKHTTELRFGRGSARLRKLCHILDMDFPSYSLLSNAFDRSINRLPAYPIISKIEAELLSMFDLPPEASDLDILTRLINMNESS